MTDSKQRLQLFEIDKIQRRFEEALKYLQSNELNIATWEITIPGGGKYKFQKFREEMQRLMIEGYANEAAEKMLVTMDFVANYLDITRAKFTDIFEKLLQITDARNQYIEELEKELTSYEENKLEGSVELEKLNEDILQAKEKLIFFDEMTDFTRDRMLEFLLFLDNLTNKKKIDIQDSSDLMVKEFKRLRKIISAKLESKIEVEKEGEEESSSGMIDKEDKRFKEVSKLIDN